MPQTVQIQTYKYEELSPKAARRGGVMTCSICGKPIVLMPSAAERARRFGGRPGDYTRLFTAHTDCTIAKRSQDAVALMGRIAAEQQAQRVILNADDKVTR